MIPDSLSFHGVPPEDTFSLLFFDL